MRYNAFCLICPVHHRRISSCYPPRHTRCQCVTKETSISVNVTSAGNFVMNIPASRTMRKKKLNQSSKSLRQHHFKCISVVLSLLLKTSFPTPN